MKLLLIFYTFVRLWLKYKPINWFSNGIGVTKLAFAKRHRSGQLRIGDYRLHYVDGPSTFSSYESIWLQKIYKFKCDHGSPVILDCGANIGLSVLYFKSCFPDAIIVAFEPDKKVFELLEKNCAAFNDLDLRNQAVWTEQATLKFQASNDDAGKVATSDQKETVDVEAIKLANVMREYACIDFLKIDIEGAELSVLADIKDDLATVKRLFVEYHQYAGERSRLFELLDLLNQESFDVHIQPELYSDSPFSKIEVHTGMIQRVNIMAFRPE